MKYLTTFADVKYYADMEGKVYFQDKSVHTNEVHYHLVDNPPRTVRERLEYLKSSGVWEEMFWDVH